MSPISGVHANASQSTGSNSGAGSGSSAPTSNTDALTSEQTFLQLLIAQIKNQDPTNPTDPVQFVTQLTQYSELEQLIGINQGVKSLDSSVDPTAANGTSQNQQS